ncbi:UPF0098 protein [Mesorhizobium tianshanense]|uniref:PBP family phospholipid-binding protein n=1 Tax=Mesorhizobium tianshanense TaxID=39844 RepID=A0A562N839_9HYPH|nr:YbhB/YbcL family Raf kinase inhibitor-like protein [Mesorhizobium tianshanense]TWI28273.1 hypothetical protein IQ26_05313 [Mesorhizobium tianshanense]GLS38859.1 UPF0098 protein [Mesorhizobium tianshanense]
MDFTLTSPVFANGTIIPGRHTCTGEDVSPPFEWQGAPEETKSFALLCHDPDAPGGSFHHWAVFGIPADSQRIAEGLPRMEALPDGLRQAVNDFDRIGYAGPCPPRGHGTHHYHFRLLAIGVDHLGLGSQAHCRQVAKAARTHLLAAAEIIGHYER